MESRKDTVGQIPLKLEASQRELVQDQARFEDGVRQTHSQLQKVRHYSEQSARDGPTTTQSYKVYRPGHYPTVAEFREKQALAASQSRVNQNVTLPEAVYSPERQDSWSGVRDWGTLMSHGHTTEAAPQHEEDVAWQPSLVIGSSSIDAGNPSLKEVARRNMLQWEHIYQHHRKQNVGAFQLRVLDGRREDARREYEGICARADPEDDIPRNETRAFRRERVQSRLAVLREALAKSTEPECEPMRTNIAAAIRGYQDGTIECSATYTLIFAGRIVDMTCRTWAEFAVDRQQRLDQYFQQYGPGYIWWEPPLATRDSLNAKKSVALDIERYDNQVQFRDDQSHFRVKMAFRKESALTCRVGGGQAWQPTLVNEENTKPAAPKRKWVWAEEDESEAELLERARDQAADGYDPHARPCSRTEKAGKGVSFSRLKTSGAIQPPRNTYLARAATRPTVAGQAQFFELLLDSGAESPILYHADFVSLGFSTTDMNAATVISVNMAAGAKSTQLLFELLVGVQLDMSEPYAQELFPTCVIKLDSSIKPPSGFGGERLSGVFPFLAYYMSFAPGMDKAHLGDERSDVLGMQRIPGGLRYDPFVKPRLGEPRQTFLNKLQANPSKVIFEHRSKAGRRKLVDREVDSEGGASQISLVRRNGSVQKTWVVVPQETKGEWRLAEYVE